MSQDYFNLKGQEEKALARSIHVGALCRVERFDPQRMRVDVQPLSRELDGGSYRAPPPVLGVPVALIRGGGFVLRPWYAAGDKGVLLYLDHDIDRIAASGEEGQPNTERNHACEDAVFVGAFVPGIDPVQGLPEQALVLAAEEGDRPYIALKKDGIEIKGNIKLTGDITQVGKTVVSVDVVAAGKSLATHIHPTPCGPSEAPK